MDDLRVFFARYLFSILDGMTLGTWLELLRQNGFQIGCRYWPRAFCLTAFSLANSTLALCERRLFGADIDAVRVMPPLFILGHFRSGTTHLHNLLALDSQFTYPTLYQVLFPSTFIVTRTPCSPLASFFLPRRRPQDNVDVGIDLPAEEEYALCAMTSLSPYLAATFPKRSELYEQYLTLRGLPDREIARWKEALLSFLKKLTWTCPRPCLLKSPPNTARIRLLLELFPEARFVHVHRDPYEVFQSTKHMWRSGLAYWRFQNVSEEDLDARILNLYSVMYNAFFDERRMIPEGHLYEVGFEAIARDPLNELRGVYEGLGLSGYDALRGRLVEYLGRTGGYKRNEYAGLPMPLRRRIAEAWRRSFDEWGYPI